MKSRFFNFLLMGSIVFSLLSSSCSKDDDDADDDTLAPNTFRDSRDNKVYKTVEIGNQVWMAENLKYTGNNGVQEHIPIYTEWVSSNNNGWCYYGNSDGYGSTYGVIYQWEAAKKACPDGWHLPTIAEWDELVDYLGEYATSKLAGNATLWKDGILTKNADFGTSGFSALPCGKRTPHGGQFKDMGEIGWWWTASVDGNSDPYGCNIYYGSQSNLSKISSNMGTGFYIRCIKN